MKVLFNYNGSEVPPKTGQRGLNGHCAWSPHQSSASRTQDLSVFAAGSGNQPGRSGLLISRTLEWPEVFFVSGGNNGMVQPLCFILAPIQLDFQT